MIIRTAEFVKSSAALKQCPESRLPEYAFIGRSNVGKSSLINMVVGRNKLAQVSSTPGKTRLINHFIINGEWHIVDLPGYGYAKISKSSREEFKHMIMDYISKREQLMLIFVLIDSRLEPQKIDLQFIEQLGELQAPFALVFTKTDKLSKTKLEANITHYKEVLSESWEELPAIFLESSVTGAGRQEILNYIDEINLTV
ncbi:MAG: ribosome biogenesis GTP-binding protein YihA/YsxC [Prevotellaceae bacterium]|jgi:GTP-binding protein|nr:ribosome biogenesis GTP-binding protein YihA/YsxC [Prevotellaceae bacterium]